MAVSLRARWEGNFWHFHDNVLSKLMVVDDLGLADGIPLLVGKALWDSAFFSQIRALPGFRERNWVLHDRPVRADRAIVCLEGSFRPANMIYAHQTLTAGSATEPSPGATAGRSPRSQPFVFLPRPKRRERHLDNERDLAEHLAPEGFAAVDAEQLSLEDRLRIFRHARCVVLPEGAGLANLVHRIGEPTGVVEILPADKRLHQPYGVLALPRARVRVSSRGRQPPHATRQLHRRSREGHGRGTGRHPGTVRTERRRASHCAGGVEHAAAETRSSARAQRMTRARSRSARVVFVLVRA